MSLPDVDITVKSSGLGLVQPGVGNQGLEAGWATSGPGGVVLAFGDTGSVQSEYVSGPLVEDACFLLACGAPEVLCCRVYSGSQGSTTHTGSGSGTVAFSGAPISPYGIVNSTGSSGILVNIFAGGTNTTATFQYSLDGGVTFSTPQNIPSGLTYAVPNTGVTLTFAGSGTAWVTSDTYVAPITSATGSVSAVVQNGASGAAAGEGLITTTGSVPIDDLSVVVDVVASGELGAGTFQASFDGGLTFGAVTLIPSGGGPVVIGNGVQLTFANTGGGGSTPGFVEGDQYRFTTSRPGYTTTDVTNVTNLIVGSPYTWGWMHFVGRTSTPTAAATFASILSTQVTMFAANSRYCFMMMECPYDSTGSSIDTALQSAFSSFTSDRVMVCAGDASCTSPVQGTEVSRSCAWPVAARCATVPIGHDLGDVEDDALTGVAAIDRDESQTPNLDSFGFTTLRTIRGEPGFWISNGRMMAAPTSDFQLAQFRRVMDVACDAGRQALLAFLNSDVRVNPSNGTIVEQDARTIEQAVTAAIETALSGQVSGVSVQVSRTHNILTDESLPVTIAITSLGYLKNILATLGFVNPGLALAA